MKRGAPDHPKMDALAEALGIELWGAVGLMECLWHFTAKFAPAGDIGKYSNWQIANKLGWQGDPSALMQALVNAHFVDHDDQHHYIVHDWSQHCEDAVQRELARKGQRFADGKKPNIARLKKNSYYLPRRYV